VGRFTLAGPQLWKLLPVTTRATSANTSNKPEDAPVSMSGRLVADYSTSEELVTLNLD